MVRVYTGKKQSIDELLTAWYLTHLGQEIKMWEPPWQPLNPFKYGESQPAVTNEATSSLHWPLQFEINSELNCFCGKCICKHPALCRRVTLRQNCHTQEAGRIQTPEAAGMSVIWSAPWTQWNNWISTSRSVWVYQRNKFKILCHSVLCFCSCADLIAQSPLQYREI